MQAETQNPTIYQNEDVSSTTGKYLNPTLSRYGSDTASRPFNYLVFTPTTLYKCIPPNNILLNPCSL